MFRTEPYRWEIRFAVVSLLVVALLGWVVQAQLSRFVTDRVLDWQAAETGDDFRTLQRALAFVDWTRPLTPAEVAVVDGVIRKNLPAQVLLVKIWSPQGQVLYSTEPAIIGKTFDVEAGLASALAGRRFADVSDLTRSENQEERALGLKRALEVYLPIRAEDGRVVGAFESYRDASTLWDELAHLRRFLVVVFIAGLSALWAALLLLAHGMSVRLRRQHAELGRLNEALQRAVHRVEDTLRGALRALAEAVEAKDEYVAGHVERVAAYAELMAEEMGLPADERETVVRGAILHDIGKMAVPDRILGKPGALTEEERQIMQTHAARGEAIVSRIPGLESAAAIVRHHHERWDGQGYPDGLAGEEIPIGARIVAVADAFDAMTTDRVYRRAMPYQAALQELVAQSGRQFAPDAVDALCRALRKMAGHRPAGTSIPSGAVQAAAETGHGADRVQAAGHRG
ncbi:MAG: HD domain-containing protein [Clostridia bacterium]|nr:HD domain-containing protein [Clostridia bacterium]